MPHNMNMRLDHTVIWVADLEGTAKFLREVVGLRQHPMEIGVSDDDPTVGGMEGIFFDGNGVWLELILPTTPGPGMDILEKKGPGAIVEINFLPEDYDGVIAKMREDGVTMLNMDGSPLGDDGGLIKEGVGTGDDIEHTGQRIAYWPVSLTRGTSVEIFEVIPGNDAGLINIRDNLWADMPPAGPNDPWVSHIAIFCKDLEATSSFYTDVLGLNAHSEDLIVDGGKNKLLGSFKGRFIDANGVWLELVQPTGPGALMDTLNRKGDGFLAEICLQVADLDSYAASVRERGVRMVNIDGSPVDSEHCVLAPFGDKMAYFPQEVSCGMVVEVVEKGPRKTSCLPNWQGRKVV